MFVVEADAPVCALPRRPDGALAYALGPVGFVPLGPSVGANVDLVGLPHIPGFSAKLRACERLPAERL